MLKLLHWPKLKAEKKDKEYQDQITAAMRIWSSKKALSLPLKNTNAALAVKREWTIPKEK